ncbi:MAG: hypothetical protein RIS94_2060, partial [Pseudomonadota bacterium]
MMYLPMTIDGRDVDAAARMDVVNPADGQPFAEAPDAGEAELDRAVAAARAAFPA